MKKTSGGGDLNAQLNSIATDLILKQAIRDKVAQASGHRQKHATTQHDLGDELELDGDTDLQNIREMRKQKVKAQLAARQQHMNNGGGTYELVDEDTFFHLVTSTKILVCHFFHREFQKCKVMDKHLAKIAANHVESKFVKLDAEKGPFVSTKLAIRVLPTVIVFVDGIAKHRILGFEGLSGVEDFKTERLLKMLRKFKAIQAVTLDESDESSEEE